ncbi:MAG: hypothetical protein OXP08_09140, partial [bacterium]|nr:hypothetical protein [bacterium]
RPPSARRLRRGLLASLLLLPLLTGHAPEAAAQSRGISVGFFGQYLGFNSFHILEGGSDRLGVVLDTEPTGDVTVTVSGHAGTDLGVDTDGDTPGDQATLTFTPSDWDVPQPVEVRGAEDADADDEAGVRVYFTASGADYGGVSTNHVLTVDDDDVKSPTYTAYFAQSTYVAIEDEGHVDIQFKLSRALPRGQWFDFRYDNLTAGKLDYSPRKRLWVEAGDANPILRIPVVADRGVEDNELFRIYLVKGPRYEVPSPSVQVDVIIKDPPYWTSENKGIFVCRGRIPGKSYPATLVPDPADEDNPLSVPDGGDQLFVPPSGLEVSWDRGSSYRAGETAKLTVRTKDGKRSCTTVYVPVSITSQTAEEVARGYPHSTRSGDDHPLAPGFKSQRNVTLRPGDSEVTVEVPLQADGRVGYRLPRASATLRGTPVHVEGATAAVSGYPTAFVWRTVDAPAGLSFARRSLKVRESAAGTVNLGVNIAPAAATAFALGFTVEGTATPGADYTIPGLSGKSGSVSVSAGATSATIPVTIVDDSIEDSGETIVLRLAAGGGRAVADPGRMTVTILNHDTDDLGSLLEAERDRAAADGDTALADLCRRALALVRGEAPPDGLSALTGAEAEAQAAVETARGKAALAAMWLDVAHLAGHAGGATPPEPEVTVAAGSAVTEGGDVSFVFTATPAPASDLDVTVTVATAGDYGITAGTRTVTIPTSGTHTLTLSTTDDGEDEKDGEVGVTVTDGTGYTVGTSATGTVSVQDDDEASGPDWTDFQAVVDRIVEARDHPTDAWAKGGGNAHHRAKWNRVLEAIGHDTGTGVSPMPASEIHANAAKWPESTFHAASVYLKHLESLEDGSDDPAVTVSAGSAVTEGGSASFVLTASPAPAADLDVTVTVATQGEYGITAGTRTVTIPATGTHTLTLSTTDDGEDEKDGSVTVTVADGAGWTAG